MRSLGSRNDFDTPRTTAAAGSAVGAAIRGNLALPSPVPAQPIQLAARAYAELAARPGRARMAQPEGEPHEQLVELDAAAVVAQAPGADRPPVARELPVHEGEAPSGRRQPAPQVVVLRAAEPAGVAASLADGPRAHRGGGQRDRVLLRYLRKRVDRVRRRIEDV